MKFNAPRVVVTSLVAILAACNLYTKFFYAYGTDQKSQSSATALESLAKLADIPSNAVVMVDVPEHAINMLISLYTRGHPTSEYSGQPVVSLYGSTEYLAPFLPGIFPAVVELTGKFVDAFRSAKFSLDYESAEHKFHRYVLLDDIAKVGAVMVTAAADQSIINQSADRPAHGRFHVKSLVDTHNHLAQVESSLGHVALPGRWKDIALWDREADFADPSRSIQATGRHILFEVVNPIPVSRMLLEWTRGPVEGDGFALPPAEVIGAGRSGFGFVGRGAGRMTSEPLVPRLIDGHFYVAVDMHADPERFAGKSKGLAALYNQRFGLDPRSLTGFARNISFVTEEQFRAIKAPQSIAHFPMGLFDPGLLFSGVYEDGWIAEVARVRLGSEKKVRSLRMKGHVPGFNQLSTGVALEVLVDGQRTALRQLAAGDFDLQAVVPETNGPRWIELRLDRVDHLSSDDRRVASIRLTSIELVEDSPEQARALSPPQAIRSFPADLLQPGLSFSGIYDDGWIAEVARIRLGSEKKVRSLRMKGHVPGFNQLSTGVALEVLVDGQRTALRQLAAGDFDLQAVVPETNGPRWIELRLDRVDHLSSDDRRVVSIRLTSIELVEDSPEQARALSPPQAIRSFPADLLQPGLSFSGIYDDGWIAEVARIRLGSEKKVGRIRITGEVPGFNRLRAGATIGVVVDGQEVARRPFRAGEFELEAAIPETEGPRWIEIQSDITDHLSAADQRVASILLKSIQLMESP